MPSSILLAPFARDVVGALVVEINASEQFAFVQNVRFRFVSAAGGVCNVGKLGTSMSLIRVFSVAIRTIRQNLNRSSNTIVSKARRKSRGGNSGERLDQLGAFFCQMHFGKHRNKTNSISKLPV